MNSEVIKRLTEELTYSRSKNPSYSLRAFSNRLNIHASALSEILNGKREVTKKMGTKILEGLGVSPDEIDIILNNKKRSSHSDLSLEHFKVISDWYYFAILSLAEIDGFSDDPLWLAERLNITPKLAREALNRLITLGYLERGDENDLHVTNINYKTPTDIANSSLKNHTSQTLELASNSLFRDSVEKRDFSTVTMAIDTDQIPVAKNMIRSFRKKLSKKLESGNKNEVYKLSIQLFPLSRNINNKEKNHETDH
jgi:transcriptional regulator with XRE-family HTH domain